MDKKKLILLVGALVIAIGTAFLAKAMFSGAAAPKVEAAAQPAQGPKVLVAARSLPVGTIITPDSFSFQPWPEDLIEKAYYLSGQTDQASLVGTVVRHPITAGQPLTQGAIVHPGDRGFLAAALGAGMRAVTVPVSARTGVAGFVFPGDRIDLVLTQTVPGQDGGSALKASETIIRNLRVLATDQRVNAVNEDNKSVVRTFSTVTVEATPKLAEKIAVAQTIGTLSLSLRSIADNEAELERAIASGEVEIPDSDDPEAEEKFLHNVANRPVDTDKTYSTGGDVSRFQRRTIPRATKAPPPPAASVAGGAPVRAVQVSNQPSVRVSRGKSVTVVPVGGK